jgi:hypothetical protein
MKDGEACVQLAAAVGVPSKGLPRWTSRLGPFDPPELPTDARAAGIDVADRFLMSALRSGAFLPTEDIVALRKHWSPRLNHYHLFDRRQDADEFADLSNSRFPEHAPFFPLYLYKLVTLACATTGEGT